MSNKDAGSFTSMKMKLTFRRVYPTNRLVQHDPLIEQGKQGIQLAI
jgi:hypothetical protein